MTADSNISRIVYDNRDRILDHINANLDILVTQLAGSERLTDDEFHRLSGNLAHLESFVEAQADRLIELLEKEIEALIKWRIEHDPELYTQDVVNELMDESHD